MNDKDNRLNFPIPSNWRYDFREIFQTTLETKHEKVRKGINDAVEKFLNDNLNDDFTDKDIIVRKINGEYIASLDKKRNEKIKQIFKEDE
jgi:predicted component of type VI protein secretion system